MIDNVYKNAFKEVYDILQNTDNELIEKIPQKFITFLQSNMNKNYITNIDNSIALDGQSFLPETEDILSLIYRSYWATEEEKLEFLNKDKQEFIKAEEHKKELYPNITEIFEKREKINNVTLDNDLIVIKKENWIHKFFNKILKIFCK